MTDRNDPPSLKDLDDRLRQARAREDVDTGRSRQGSIARSSGMALGFRIAVELVAGVMVGFGIGYGLDLWLGTKPWLMVLFLVLGAAAGLQNVYRAAKGLDETVGLGRADRDARDADQDRNESS